MTIEADELRDGYCPECFEMDGGKRYEFEEINGENNGQARYRCLGCGAIVESSGPGAKP